MHNEDKMIDQIILDLQSGKNIGIISDAGMPVINDPGQKLINKINI
jgi:16S rRNA (cytidine1402-2'-O)-methyltransferase